MNRFLKQFIYAFFFFFVICLIFGLFFLFKSKPKEPQLSFKTLDVEWTKFVNVNGQITILTSLLNPNLDFPAEFDYRIRIYNPYGGMIKEVNKSSFIYAGEKKYLIESIDIGEQSVGRVNLDIQKTSFLKKKILSPKTEILFKSTQVIDRNYFLKGKIRNNENLPLYHIKLIAFVLENHHLLLASSTYIQKLDANQETLFEIFFPNVKDIKLLQQPVTIYIEAKYKP